MKYSFDAYEKLAKEVEAVLNQLPEATRQAAIECFRKLDDKMESLLVLNEAGSLPTSYKVT